MHLMVNFGASSLLVTLMIKRKATKTIDGGPSGTDIPVAPRPMPSFMGKEFLFDHQLLLAVKKLFSGLPCSLSMVQILLP